MESNSQQAVQYGTNDLVIDNQEKELNLFRSMYYQLNAKPDSMARMFSRKVLITRDDIIELNRQVADKIKLHYQDDGYFATITVNLSNKQVLNFQCWEEFVAYQWTETYCINSVIMKWNFNIRMPQYEYPQTHVLMVKMTNGLRPEEVLNMIFSGKVEDFDEIETNTFPVAARVDFIEPMLGEELINIVSKWVKGLKHNRSKKNIFILFLQKYRKRVAQYFNYVSFIMVTILGALLINNMVHSFDAVVLGDIEISQFLHLFNSVIAYLVVLFLSLKFSEKMGEKIYDSLARYGECYVFSITKGDLEKQEDIKEKDERSARKIIFQFVCSLLFNVGCGVISGLII